MTTNVKLSDEAEILDNGLDRSTLPPRVRVALDRVLLAVRDQDYLTTGQVAERLDIRSINTVDRLARSGHLAGAFRDEGGTWKIPFSAVIALENERARARRASQSVEAAAAALRIGKTVSPRIPVE